MPKPSVTLQSAAPIRVAKGSYGAICGSKKIIGAPLAPVRGKLRGCGIAEPVRVVQVEGIRLSSPAMMDCTTAKALATWVKKGAKPAFKGLGGGLTGLRVAAGYSCRTRNSQPGAKLSEHAKGRAIDISGFYLQNKKIVTLLDGWRQPQLRKRLQRAQNAACGIFGTVLGPNANRFHRDHFHFDTARYRSGSYCR